MGVRKTGLEGLEDEGQNNQVEGGLGKGGGGEWAVGG